MREGIASVITRVLEQISLQAVIEVHGDIEIDEPPMPAKLEAAVINERDHEDSDEADMERAIKSHAAIAKTRRQMGP